MVPGEGDPDHAEAGVDVRRVRVQDLVVDRFGLFNALQAPVGVGEQRELGPSGFIRERVAGDDLEHLVIAVLLEQRAALRAASSVGPIQFGDRKSVV